MLPTASRSYKSEGHCSSVWVFEALENQLLCMITPCFDDTLYLSTVHYLRLQPILSHCISQLCLMCRQKDRCFVYIQNLIRFFHSTQVPFRKDADLIRALQKQTGGKSQPLQPQSRPRHSCLYSSNRITSPTLPQRALSGPVYCFLHSAPWVPLKLQTLALKGFNHVNLGHCQLHCSLSTLWCFSNTFGGRNVCNKHFYKSQTYLTALLIYSQKHTVAEFVTPTQ